MKTKRLLSIVLSIALCLSLLPMAAIAEANTSGTRLTADIGTLSGGSYYLSSDLELTTDLTVTGTVNLYLNGYMLKGTGNGSVISVNGGTLNLYDDADSTETHNIVDPATGEIVSILGGLITGGTGTNISDESYVGGGVFVADNGTFRLHGGTIAGNTVGQEEKSGSRGAGVYARDNAVFDMVGGAVRYNIVISGTTESDTMITAWGGSGGGISLNNASLTMTGGSVDNNRAGWGGGIYLEGSRAKFKIENGSVNNNSNTHYEGGGIYVAGSLDAPGGKVTISGGEIKNNSAGIQGGKHTSGGAISILCGELLVSGGELSGNLGNCGGAVMAYGSKVTVSGGAIHNNIAELWGGGIALSGGSFSMTGGIISRNAANDSQGGGGGLQIGGGDGPFTISGGEICNNTARSFGGGIWTDNCTLTFSNGIIDGNTAAQGGGIGVGPTGTLVMSGGKIENNESIGDGGGIFMWSGNYGSENPAVTISGGTISNNSSCNSMGGGIFADGTLNISGAPNITGNVKNTGDSISDSSANNVYLNFSAAQRGTIISVTDPLSDGAVIGVTSWDVPTMDAPVTITSGYDVNNSRIAPVAFFASDNERYQVLYSADETEAVLALIPPPTYTATFMADGEVVDTITFEEGDATLSEPAVPAKTHYDGAWESYDLAAATDDITVNAVYTLNNSHSYTAASTVSPTCTEQGYTAYRCSVCGDEYNGNYTAALGHDYHLNKSKSLAPAVGVGGYDYYECSHDDSHFYKTALPAQKATHTATFMIGDTVVAVVTFTEGDTTLSEPAIPDHANYVGAWDAYDLANATEDIVIQGRYTPVDPDQVSDLGADASATYANGVATITLSASAPSRTIKVTSNQAKPVDVVLVLDQSGSMADTLGARQSKRDALVSCANDFVTQLYQNAVATGADHRVALVGFAYSAYNNGKYANTGLLATTSGSGKNYASLKDADYKTALIPINNGGVINANVVAGINSIVADGATAADLGLKMAKNIFTENPANGTRERIVIFITDGTPTSWGEIPSLITQTAADAISVANTIKNTQNAKIYSVGVETSASPTAAFSSAASGVTIDWRGNFVSYDFNRFLHAVSSNYPSAASMSNMGSGDKSTGYYMAVNDTNSLGQIFTNILYNTVYELKTFDKATLFYTLTSDFTLTLEQELALRNRLKADYGLTDADITVLRNVDGTTSLRFQNVKAVQGYDASGNLCYTATVSFEVSANKDASGTVATGTSDSGAAYEGSDAVSFTIPSVNITSERNIIVFKIGGKVYRMLDLPLGSAITVPESELAKWTIPDGTVVEGSYAEFEATEVSDTYSIHWIIDGEETVQSYAVGDRITPPAVPEKAGFDFTGWSPSVPATMPLYSLICTAIYTPEHDHEWIEVYKTGTCDTGITTHYECICGKSKDETAEAHDHSFTAVLSDNGSAGNTVEKLVCTDCGYSKDQNVTFKVTYSQSRKTTVLDLNLYENDVSVTEPSQGVEMRFYIGDTGKSYSVTRIDPNGTRTTYRAEPEDGYLVFTLDHFSVYVLSELDEATNEPVETLSYAESVQLLDAAQPVVDNTPLPENQNQNSGNTVDNTPSNDSSGRGSVWHGSSSGASSGSGGNTGKPEEQKPLEIVFADVAESAYYYTAVSWAVRLGITNGTGDGTFSPNKSCSRAEIVTFLWRAKGSPEPTLTENPFDDLDADAYYYRAALWAYENGITYGASATSFAPNMECTRSQAVTFLWRAENQPKADASDFVDVGSEAYYAAAVNWAAAQEITNGTGNGAFSPDVVCSRAQIVTFLYRDLAKGKIA